MSKHLGAGGGLRADALGTFDSVVMAIAGCGPAYTIAVTLPVLIAAVGVAGPAVLLYCAIPMVGIALAFRHLGRLDPNAGAAYAWVGRSLHPFLGFLGGWAVVVSTTVFMASSALPAGSATLALLGLDAGGSTALATAVGAVWFLLVACVVMFGARISAHAQTLITGTQLVLLVVFAVAAMSKDGNAADFSLSWFGFGHFGQSGGEGGFVTGALIAVFAYWGWDVTSNLGEETRGGRRGSGFGGVIGVLTVFALFTVFTIAVNILIGTEAVRRSPGDFLTVLGDAIWPGWGGRLLVLAVLLSTVATLETSLIQATRTLFAMGRDRTLPPAFGRLHPRRQAPWTATAVVAAVALVLTAAVNLGSGARLLADALSGIGLQIAFYYSLTAFSAVVVHRKTLFTSAGNLLLIGVWPLCGGLFMLWILARSVTELSAAALTIGLGTLALGIVPMLRSWFRGRSYFRPSPLDPQRAQDVDDSYGVPGHGPARAASGRPDELLTDF
ncbi:MULTISPECIES: APC family permease [unclassified Streptomyces]|uniref:APC family permease n=1 Tax=unclassified Streptomyces TaxID=2593676 RepID=UPI0022531D7B|nr:MULTISPECIES: APC family permease [unclassified Streptomyces]MCX4529796.1 APC family permease [Streptomyces sp. NBC_01551]MCX4539632.1 APC family permease [Streptomyces sp. NBC_01565]